MSSHQFTIEKAKFSAGLLKPDITTISREQIASFVELLDRTILRCSSTNIESCKAWLLRDIVPSSARVSVLAKYLVALAKLQAGLEKKSEDSGPARSKFYRRRLHVLYLVNDVLHDTKYHSSDSTQFSTFSGFIQPALVDLIQLASGGSGQRIRGRIDLLLQVWEEEAFFSTDYVNKLRGAALQDVTDPAEDEAVDAAVWSGERRQQPYMMPASHGDLSTPFYDLPAGNLMRHIMPNRSDPIHPDDVRPLQFVAGPADESLVMAVQDFMTAVSDIDGGAIHGGEDEDPVESVDELGQISFRDETGEPVPGRTYYGWSREFCDKMKIRGKGPVRDRSSSFSRSRSRSRSRSPRKRRRYSDSNGGRSMSYSRSRSRPRDLSRRVDQGRDRRGRSRSGSHSRSRSRSRTYSPSYRPALAASVAETTPSFQPGWHEGFQHPYPMPHNLAPRPSMPTPIMPFQPLPFPPPLLGPGGVPIAPPPRPPNYSGPWPPLPPPPPMFPGMAFNSPMSSGQGHSGPSPGLARHPSQQGRGGQLDHGQ